MGWCSDTPEHEGYIVGVIEERYGGFRELRSPDHRELGVISLRAVQVGCDCGWRSARLACPFGTTWAPFTVLVRDPAFDERCRRLWLAHVQHGRES